MPVWHSARIYGFEKAVNLLHPSSNNDYLKKVKAEKLKN